MKKTIVWLKTLYSWNKLCFPEEKKVLKIPQIHLLPKSLDTQKLRLPLISPVQGTSTPQYRGIFRSSTLHSLTLPDFGTAISWWIPSSWFEGLKVKWLNQIKNLDLTIYARSRTTRMFQRQHHFVDLLIGVNFTWFHTPADAFKVELSTSLWVECQWAPRFMKSNIEWHRPALQSWESPWRSKEQDG